MSHLSNVAMNKMCALVAIITLAAGSSAFAGSITLGDLAPATLPSGPAVDGFTGGVYVDTAQAFGANGVASSATFNAGATGRELTFMVGTFSGSQFTPTGIFNGILPTSLGVQTVDLTALGLASGSASVTAGETFAWTDQTIGGSSNPGTIWYGGGTYNVFTADASQNEHPVIGTPTGNLLVGNGTFGNREYTVNFTVITPEPSAAIAIVGLCGMGLMGLVIRRRRKS